MKLDEAIERLEKRIKTAQAVNGPGAGKDLRLGIEALKQRQWEKEAGFLDNAPLLLGETEE